MLTFSVLAYQAVALESWEQYTKCTLVHDYAALTMSGGLETMEPTNELGRQSYKSIPDSAKSVIVEKITQELLDEYLKSYQPGEVEIDGKIVRQTPKPKATAVLESTSEKVRVLLNAPIEAWRTREKVAMAGFLCQDPGQSPVLFSFPTPCVPAAVAANGMPKPDAGAGYSVWVATEKKTFDTKSQADTWCQAYYSQWAAEHKPTPVEGKLVEMCESQKPQFQALSKGAKCEDKKDKKPKITFCGGIKTCAEMKEKKKCNYCWVAQEFCAKTCGFCKDDGSSTTSTGSETTSTEATAPEGDQQGSGSQNSEDETKVDSEVKKSAKDPDSAAMALLSMALTAALL